jgi:hypothetical protein
MKKTPAAKIATVIQTVTDESDSLDPEGSDPDRTNPDDAKVDDFCDRAGREAFIVLSSSPSRYRLNQ